MSLPAISMRARKGGQLANKTITGLCTVITGLALLLAMPSAVKAAGTVLVGPNALQGWSVANSPAGATTTFVNDSTAPSGTGVLRLTTDSTSDAFASLAHTASDPLANVNSLSYSTKQNSTALPQSDASFYVKLQVNGLSDTTTWTNLVFDPAQNTDQGSVTGSWQTWNVAAGHFWSTRTATCYNPYANVILGSSGGPANYTLSQIKTMCPNAVVTEFGVSIGSGIVYRQNYDVEADLFNYNGTVYDFETSVPVTLTNKKDCMNGGWATSTNPVFKSQSECVNYFTKH